MCPHLKCSHRAKHSQAPILCNVPPVGVLFCWPGARLKKRPPRPRLSAGCADAAAAAQTADSCSSLASSICYLETSDFITAAALAGWLLRGLFCPSVCTSMIVFGCTPFQSGRASQSPALLRLSASASLHLRLSPSPSLIRPPGVRIHLHLATQALIDQRQSPDGNKVSSQMTPLVDRYTSNKITRPGT